MGTAKAKKSARDRLLQRLKPRDAMGQPKISPGNPRILHVAQTIAGGIASYFEEIADYQIETFGRENVRFVVPRATEYLPRIDRKHLICFDSTSRTPVALTRFAMTVVRAIRSFQPDVVHLHSSFAGAIVRPLLAAAVRRPRVIYCPHGWSFSMEMSAAKQRAYAMVERQLARLTDLIHVNSRSESELALEFGLPSEKIRVVANGIAWTPSRESGAKSGNIRVAFIGRHDRQKGLDILLDTVRRFPLGRIQFDIVGDGVLAPQADKAEKWPSGVIFHGWLSRQQCLELLEQVDAVVMPSRWDAAPIVATEAMRAGVPVIGSNRGAIPEIVQHGVGGYIFDLNDPDSLAETLENLRRPDLEQLGRSARDRWEQLYVADRMNKLTCDVYAEVLGRPLPRTGDCARVPVSQAQPCG